MAEPAPTRRSSRPRSADSATPSGVEASVSPVTPALSRRELRERQRAAMDQAAPVAAESLIEDVAQQVSLVAGVVADAVAQATETAADSPISLAVSVDEVQLGESAAAASASEADAFAAATRAFGTSPSTRRGSSFVRAVEAPASTTPSLPAEATTVHVAPRRGTGLRRKFVAVGATVGVMGIAGLLAVSMTLPAEAVAAAQGAQVASATSLVAASQAATSVDDGEIQAFVASSDVQNDLIERSESFSTESLIDLAAQQGISYSNTVYTNDPDAAIQWPFMVGVGMSSPYGMRDTGMHEGIDLVPGAGAPVQAIADGTVRIATESGGNYGVTVYIDHIIDGKLITSHYSHMQYGSLRVSVGDIVHVGDIIGQVGNTGRSYGAHMHFELIVNGATIDPLPWLNTNAGRYDGVTSPDAAGTEDDTSE